jgi:hypothetical protein
MALKPTVARYALTDQGCRPHPARRMGETKMYQILAMHLFFDF